MSLSALILVGLPGCGKTTASEFFQFRKIPVVRMGKLTDIELKNRKLPKTSGNEKKVRDGLRKRFGEDVYGRYTLSEIRSLPKKDALVVIEGMKSLIELRYIKRQIRNIKIIYIQAGKKVRFERLAKRKIRPLNPQEASVRDQDEIQHFGINELKKKADYNIRNDRSIDRFRSQLDIILKQNQ